MASYATMKGRAAQAAPADHQRSALPQVSAQQAQEIQANKEFVVEKMPELVDFIRDLHADGLFDGWRAVKNCRLLREES